jgi:hypothetical protein
MGYVPLQDIKHRQGYIDISIHSDGAVRIVNEVKRDWGLSRHDAKAVDQAYRYANRSGARLVVVTNGDYYAFFDRDRGRSIDENFVAEFRLSNLASKDLETLNLLRRNMQEPKT